MSLKKITGIRWSYLFALFAMCMEVTGQGTVIHKEGPYYEGFMPNGVQKTHEYWSVVYVNPASSQTTLELQSTSSATPHAYFRWYDYTNDLASPRIQPGITMYTNGRVQRGGNGMFSLYYYINAAALPDTLACNVSAYKDWEVRGDDLVEPTLSFRTIFEVRDGNEIATQLQQLTQQGEYLQESTVYMPAVPASTHQPHRVTLEHNPSNYLGYTNAGVLSTGTLVASGNTLNTSATYTNKFPFVYINPGPAGTTDEITVKLLIGSGASQVEYNIARFNIEFIDENPEPFTNTGYRSLEFLDENYVLLSKLDFDYNTAIATPQNNVWSIPLDWDVCEYGFSSKNLYDQGYRDFNNILAQHNEYGFYKTANVSRAGISGLSWYNGGKQVYDRLHYTSGGEQEGYFMYIDAAQAPGIVATLPIDRLCPGTRLFVSTGIASLTQNGVTSYPNVNIVFLGVTEEGDKVELNRYTSGDIPSNTSNEPTPWYQLYYKFTFDTPEEYVSYLVQIENNCTSTAGGDYAIDDIQIYRSKPAVQFEQLDLPCEGDGARIKIKVEYDKLLAAMDLDEKTTGTGERGTLKFRFFNEDFSITNYDYNTGTSYGQISFSSRFDEMPALTPGNYPDVATGNLNILTYTEIDTLINEEYRYVVFLVPNTIQLHTGETYYMVVADLDGNFYLDECGLMSDPFTVETMPVNSVTLDGYSLNNLEELCSNHTMTVTAKLKSRVEPYEEIDCLFDWFFGSSGDFRTEIPGTGYTPEEVLAIYRSVYPDPNESDGLSTTYQGNYTQEVHDVLRILVDAGKIVLNKKEVVKVVREDDELLAIPLTATAEIPPGTDISEVCSDIIPISIKGLSKDPMITLGNEFGKDLRAGLSQLNDLQDNPAKTLSIPVADFTNHDGTKTRILIKAPETGVFVVDSDDPQAGIDKYNSNTFVRIGEVNTIDVSDTPNDYVSFNLENSTSFTFREGYSYMLEFYFNDLKNQGELSTCDGNGKILVKVVPEYLTWTGNNGTNWNNDENWRRSLAGELYKTDYRDDIESNGFVPMDFSKVTIPAIDGNSGTVHPWLYELTGAPYLNMDNSNYTDITGKETNAATDSIAYDMVVTANGSNYTCIHFYGNTTGEIYFKPAAEMRNTQYLVYDKAHAEFEVSPNRWYMLASPLKNVVAGDMYIPTNGLRQETEAFLPIVYNTNLNDRFNPAVYQRSWDQAGSTVFRSDGSSEDAYVSANWSMVYNKVDEVYTPGKGFSLNVVSRDTNTGKALFRLPKDDTTYSYYSYDESVTNTQTPVSRTDNGRLALENLATSVQISLINQSGSNNVFLTGNPFIATLNMIEFFNLNPDFEKKYWLLTENGISGILINDDGSFVTNGDDVITPYIPPFQSFFLEKKDGTNSSTITFTPGMTTIPDGSGLRSAPATDVARNNSFLTVTASANGYRSRVLLQKEENPEDAFNPDKNMQAIADRNIPEIPLLYSMRDGKASIIRTFNVEESVPLGILSEKEEDILLTFTGLESMGTPVYLYDRESGQKTDLLNGNKVSVKGNIHGRYYLLFSEEESVILPVETQIKIVNTGKGELTVYAPTEDTLEKIRVYDINGMLIKEIESIHTHSIPVYLPSGKMYIVKISSQTASITQKVICN